MSRGRTRLDLSIFLMKFNQKFDQEGRGDVRGAFNILNEIPLIL